TTGDNAINYTGPGPNGNPGLPLVTGVITVDGQESIEFGNKTNLTINALAGDDVINLNNPTTPTGLTGITISGGDPTASDKLIVNGRAGINDSFRLSPTGPGSGRALIFGGAALPLLAC